MKKPVLLLVIIAVWLSSFCGAFSGSVVLSGGIITDFSEDFEQYAVDDYIENDSAIGAKWENNIIKDGDPVGMDVHLKNIAKVRYESGTSGNKVLHLNNLSGADTFFYLGVANDFRVKNFVAEFRVKFLAEGVKESSWVGLSFRKRANIFYTGTNNLLLTARRYVASESLAGQTYAIFNGGGVTDLAQSGSLFGEALDLKTNDYTMPDTVASGDSSWLNVKYEVSGNNYKMYVNNSAVTNLTFDIDDYDYYGYLSLNCCSANILVDDFKVAVTDTEAPPEISPLPTPQPVLDEANSVISWPAIEGVLSYNVNINGKTSLVFTNSFKLNALKDAGDYVIKVSAVSEDPFLQKNSPESEPITYSVKGDTKKGCGSYAGGSVLAVAVAVGVLMWAVLLKLPAIKNKSK